MTYEMMMNDMRNVGKREGKEEGRLEGREEGREEGRAEGEALGVAKEQRATVFRMLEAGKSEEAIMIATALDPEALHKLMKEYTAVK